MCYVHLFPEKPVLRNYKTKERAVVAFVQKAFPDKSWSIDTKIKDGCSFKRPDILCDLGDQVIIIEIDEDQHQSYDCSCENKRLMELSQDIGHRPLVLIRFNPDGYVSVDGVKHTSCWKLNKYGTCSIVSHEAWDKRLAMLQETVQYWIEQRTNKTVEVIQLYFSTESVVNTNK